MNEHWANQCTISSPAPTLENLMAVMAEAKKIRKPDFTDFLFKREAWEQFHKDNAVHDITLLDPLNRFYGIPVWIFDDVEEMSVKYVELLRNGRKPKTIGWFPSLSIEP